jgi:hypothetical protein
MSEERDYASQQFSQSLNDHVVKAVYRVVKDDAGVQQRLGIAWAFAPSKLATSARVTEAINSHLGAYYLISPLGERIEIEAARSHPGYAAFKALKGTKGTPGSENQFSPLDFASPYDVGIIYVDPAKPLPVTLELASQGDLAKLTVGMAVASAFSAPNWAGLEFGHISSLKDVFMCRADDARHRLLVQHSLPLPDWETGSPIIDADGQVIAIVSGGDTAAEPFVHFAQRVDPLSDLDADRAPEALRQEQAYWEEAGKCFDHYFDVALAAFLTDAKERYAVDNGEDTVLGEDVLRPSVEIVEQSYNFLAEPGFVYGFIADAKRGVPVGIYLVGGPTDPTKSYEPDFAPTEWARVFEPTTLQINVWGRYSQPAAYVLHVYRWKLPNRSP